MVSTTLPAAADQRSRPAAQAVAWPWRGRAAASAHAQAERAQALRRKVALRGLVGAAIAGACYALGRPTLALVAGGLATLTLALALTSPTGALAASERTLRRLGRVLGLVTTWIVMLPIFLLFFVPFGLLFRHGDRDPLRRAADPTAKSYWMRRDAVLGGDRHRSPF